MCSSIAKLVLRPIATSSPTPRTASYELRPCSLSAHRLGRQRSRLRITHSLRTSTVSLYMRKPSVGFEMAIMHSVLLLSGVSSASRSRLRGVVFVLSIDVLLLGICQFVKTSRYGTASKAHYLEKALPGTSGTAVTEHYDPRGQILWLLLPRLFLSGRTVTVFV